MNERWDDEWRRHVYKRSGNHYASPLLRSISCYFVAVLDAPGLVCFDSTKVIWPQTTSEGVLIDWITHWIRFRSVRRADLYLRSDHLDLMLTALKRECNWTQNVWNERRKSRTQHRTMNKCTNDSSFFFFYTYFSNLFITTTTCKLLIFKSLNACTSLYTFIRCSLLLLIKTSQILDYLLENFNKH